MEQDRPRRGPRSAKASAGKALRRERARERERERHRFPPLRITGAPSVDERLVVLSPPVRHCPPAPLPPSTTHQTQRVLSASWASKTREPALLPQLPANLPPTYPAPRTRTRPPAPPAQAPPRRSTSTRLGPFPAPGLSPNPALASVARPAGARARPEDITDGEAAVLARRVRARVLADRIVRQAPPAAHLEGLRAQAEFRQEQVRAPFSFSRFALDQEPRAAAVRPRSDRDLDGAVEAITDALCARLAERRETSHRGVAIPRPVPPPCPPGPLGASHQSTAEAALRHPAVVQAIHIRDAEIARLHRALVQVAGTETGREINLGAAVGASRGPVFEPAPVPPPPPPWGAPQGQP